MPPPLPREYGAWTMLVLPLLLGTMTARTATSASLLLLPASILLFLARFAAIPGGTRLKMRAPGRIVWTSTYLAASALLLLLAVSMSAPSQRAGALWLAFATGLLGVANAGLVLAGRGRTLYAEVLAMAAVALTGPLVMVLASHAVDGPALGVGAICFAYSLSTLAFVRAFREESGRRCLGAHVLLVVALVWLWRIDWLSAGLLLAFGPVLARTLWGLWRPPPNLRVLGWRELGVAAAFLVVAAIAS